VRWQYPEFVPIYLTQRELLDSVGEYRDSATGFDARVRQYLAVERLANGRLRRTIREWTDEDLQSAVTQISERNQRIQWLSLAFYRRIGRDSAPAPSLDAKIARDGRIEISGQFRLAKETVVRRVAEIGAAKLRFYSGRGMRQHQYVPAPLTIDFRRDLFADAAELRRLLGVIKTLPNSMYSVQHGNPYLHVRLFDGFDGSGFDVWAVTANAITLVPRLQCTEAAVGRLIGHVFENFREGDVSERHEP
jgi:hypothetical protein